MTRERTDRIEEIANAIASYRSELLGMQIDEIHKLPLIKRKAKRESCKARISELKKACDLFSDGLSELGY